MIVIEQQNNRRESLGSSPTVRGVKFLSTRKMGTYFSKAKLENSYTRPKMSQGGTLHSTTKWSTINSYLTKKGSTQTEVGNESVWWCFLRYKPFLIFCTFWENSKWKMKHWEKMYSVYHSVEIVRFFCHSDITWNHI